MSSAPAIELANRPPDDVFPRSSTGSGLVRHSRPALDEAEDHALRGVLASGHLVQGTQVAAFEEEVGRFLALSPGVATSSGTAALHLALLSLGVGPGDEVLLPAYVCSAPLLAVSHAGARPVLVDVEPATGNMDPFDLKKRLTRRSKAIIVVHLFGMPAAVQEFLAPGLPVIEDCAQALGAWQQERKVGTFGDVAVCSFYATKLITTGEGGMLLGRDQSRLERARDLREYDKKETFAVRFNYKMTDIQAAIGRVQLGKLGRFLSKREALAEVYTARLAASSRCIPPPHIQGRIYYRYVVSVPRNPTVLIRRLFDRGVEAARPVYRPLHHYLEQKGYPGAEEAWRSHLSLPLHPSLVPEEILEACRAFQETMEEIGP
jgi:dTDP-4-amino-4,6-dideoxygalactose transaminase